jgi:hypothetical protein
MVPHGLPNKRCPVFCRNGFQELEDSAPADLPPATQLIHRFGITAIPIIAGEQAPHPERSDVRVDFRPPNGLAKHLAQFLFVP